MLAKISDRFKVGKPDRLPQLHSDFKKEEFLFEVLAPNTLGCNIHLQGLK